MAVEIDNDLPFAVSKRYEIAWAQISGRIAAIGGSDDELKFTINTDRFGVSYR